MRKINLIALALSLSLAIETPLSSAAEYGILTSAGHSINNSVTNEDYKLSKEDQNSTLNLLRYSYLSKAEADESDKYVSETSARNLESNENYGTYNSSKNKSSLSTIAVAKSWLINNNILERKAALYRSSKTGLWNAIFYEKINSEYDNFKTNTVSSYLDKVGNSPTKATCSNQFRSFCNKTVDSSLVKHLRNSSMMSNTQFNSFKKTLKEYQSRLNEHLTTVKSSDYKNVYSDYLNKVVLRIEKYYQDIKVSDSDSVKKSDFLMLLYKSVFGAINSRPIVFNHEAVRNGSTYSSSTSQYWSGDSALVSKINGFIEKNNHPILKGYWDTADRTGDADFSLGDSYYYVNANVYELYLKKFLDTGMIFKKEFTSNNDDTDNLFNKSASPGKAFKDSLKTFSSADKPIWWNESGVCDGDLPGALGQCIKYNKNGSIVCREPKYFSSEKLSYQSVLEYIEDILRLSEDDMTKTEASIITYKYGLTYLAGYSASMKKTLSFLVAKGILDFENDNLMSMDLESSITYADLYVLLYRVANKNARADFSKITLTDGESFWQSKGYAQSDLGVLQSDNGFVSSESVSQLSFDDNRAPVVNGSMLSRIASFSSNIISCFVTKASATSQEYEVIKELTKSIQWTYNGTKISTFSKDNTNSEISRISTKTKNYNGKKIKVWNVVFKVKASSTQKALQHVNSKLSCPVADSDKSVTSVTKISEAGTGRSSYTMVRKDSFKKISSNISAIEDKVLMNTKTGCQAIILPDLGYALVGNSIVKTGTFLMESTSDGIYYNLKIILALLDDSYVKKLGVKDTILRTGKSVSDSYVPVSNSVSGDSGNYKAMCAKMKVTSGMAKTWGLSGVSAGDLIDLVRVDSLSTVNTLHREFTVRYKKKKHKITLVLDWTFAIPDVSDFRVGGTAYNTVISNKSSKDEINKALYERPTGSKLLTAWWDSNYVANNMFCNFLYGTSGVNYINSGYLVPSLYVLPDTTKDVDKILQTLFSGTSHPLQGQTWNKTSSSINDFKTYFGSSTDWSKSYKYFFNKSNCIDASDTGLNNEQIMSFRSLTAIYRNFKIYAPYSTSKYKGTMYDNVFFRTKSGVLYRSLESDYRIRAVKNKHGVKSLSIETRTQKTAKPTAESTIVNYGGHKMLYAGTVTAKNKGKTCKYYKLVPIDRGIVTNSQDKLFNCGKVVTPEISSDAGIYRNEIKSSSWCYPRFVLGSKSYNSIDESLSSWKNVYRNYSKEYLASSDIPSFVTYGNAFYYSTAMQKHLLKLNSSWEQNWSIFSYGKGLNSYKKVQSKYFKLDSRYTTWLKNTKYVFHGGNTVYASPTLLDNISNFIGNMIADVRSWFNKVNIACANDTDKLISLSELDTNIKQNSPNPESNDSMTGLEAATNKRANSTRSVAVIPVLFADASKYSIYSDDNSSYNLIYDKGASALCFANYFYSGVAKSVQESIIAHYVDTVNLGDVHTGSSVMIGDMQFKVDSKQNTTGAVRLSSVAISTEKNKDLRKASASWRDKKSKTKASFRSEVADLTKSIIVYHDGKGYSLNGYIVKGKRGINLGGIRKTSNTKKRGIIYRDSATKNAKGYKSGKTRSVSVNNCNNYYYVRIHLCLSSSLKVRPVNDDKTVYTFTYSSSSDLANDDNFVFNTEELNYDKIGSPDASLFDVWFSSAEAYKIAKAKFTEVYRQAFDGDLIGLFKMIVILICMWLAVFSWLAYLVLHYGAGRVFLEALANGPGRSARGGFDLLRILSFGLYSLDDDPKLSRVVLTMFLTVAIVVIILEYL